MSIARSKCDKTSYKTSVPNTVFFLFCSDSFIKFSLWTKFHFPRGIFCLLGWYFCSDRYCLTTDIWFCWIFKVHYQKLCDTGNMTKIKVSKNSTLITASIKTLFLIEKKMIEYFQNIFKVICTSKKKPHNASKIFSIWFFYDFCHLDVNDNSKNY
jgi:hypothetical protein